MGKAVYLLPQGLIPGLHHSWLITKASYLASLAADPPAHLSPILITMALHCFPSSVFTKSSVLQAQHKRLFMIKSLHDTALQTLFLNGFKQTEILQEQYKELLCLFIQICHF